MIIDKNLPKISIVTPSFNSAKYIEDCIQSVLNQNYPNFEHIIIDGSSTDGTIRILKKYPHLKWISEPDEGQSDAINKGFKMANGEIIGWLNADEFYLKDAFKKVVNFSIQNPYAEILYGDSIYTDAESKFVRYRASHPFNYGILLYYGPFIQTCSLFLKKELILGEYILDVKFNYVMDHEYLVRLAKAQKKFSYIPEPLGVFRWVGDNKSLNYSDPNRINETLWVRQMYGRYISHSLISTKIFYCFFRTLRIITLLKYSIFQKESKMKKIFQNKLLIWF